MRIVFLCITIQSTGNCQKSSNTGLTIGTNINNKQEINPASNKYQGQKNEVEGQSQRQASAYSHLTLNPAGTLIFF